MTESESVEKGLARVDYPATTMNHSAVIESLNAARAKLDKLQGRRKSFEVLHPGMLTLRLLPSDKLRQRMYDAAQKK